MPTHGALSHPAGSLGAPWRIAPPSHRLGDTSERSRDRATPNTTPTTDRAGRVAGVTGREGGTRGGPLRASGSARASGPRRRRQDTCVVEAQRRDRGEAGRASMAALLRLPVCPPRPGDPARRPGVTGSCALNSSGAPTATRVPTGAPPLQEGHAPDVTRFPRGVRGQGRFLHEAGLSAQRLPRSRPLSPQGTHTHTHRHGATPSRPLRPPAPPVPRL